MSASRKPVETGTVLVVDDLPANRNLLRETLEPEGYEILLAPDGEAALNCKRTITRVASAS